MSKSKDQISTKSISLSNHSLNTKKNKVDTVSSINNNENPLKFLSGSLTSLLLGWFSLKLSQQMLAYFAFHSFTSTSSIGISISTALKTLIIGMTFLATFSFTFIGLGLLLVFIRSLVSNKRSTAL
uniref:DUF3082 domain-containing protein n=1 Tax=Paulinella longichromatophora TaxID=1708747 RepID=A0A2H4ZNL3_9EUKA|nr:hypothetical protein PLO_093 [Paulinella longichromatophora]